MNQQMESTLQCLRSCADALLQMSSQSLLDASNEDAIFGKYISAVLHTLPVEERNLRKQKIFAVLHGDLGELVSNNSKMANGIE